MQDVEEDMAMQAGKASYSRAKSVRGTWEYRLIYLASYPIFLAFEIIDRVVHLGSTAAQTRPRKSIFASARAAADTSLPYAFLG
jgi:hypothetical protein